MVFRLTLHGQIDQPQEMAIIVSVPQGCLDINLLLREKAAPEVTLRRQS
jgi:hypothetical protein